MSEIGRTILNQLGNRTLRMLGANDITLLKNGTSFKIKGSRKINRISIALNSMDTYDLTFYKQGGIAKLKVISTVKDVYFDQLHTVIEKETGLYTRM